MVFKNFVYDPDYDTFKEPLEGKTYISPQMPDSITGETIRLVTRGIDQKETYEVAKVKKEIVLRETEGGKKIIRATLYETPRRVSVFSIQDYTPSTGNPHKNGHAFVGEEITKLFSFLRDIQTMRFGSERYQRLSDEDIEHIEFSNAQAESIVRQNPELFSSIVQTNVTSKDIIAFAYRKKQLDIFDKLLNTDLFDRTIKKNNWKKEALWQRFFEKNTWIFGYGLGYVFLTGLDDKKLEQVVQGYNLNLHGKRVDALMKTRGIISSLCFVEIKTHQTRLLAPGEPYRPGCYAPSDELVGAIAQVQGSVEDATKTLAQKIDVKDKSGNPTGEEVFNYKAKSFLVIGSLFEFMTEHGVNEEKLRSFELFRKSIVSPEIITFDELYERARFIVEYNEGKKTPDNEMQSFE